MSKKKVPGVNLNRVKKLQGGWWQHGRPAGEWTELGGAGGVDWALALPKCPVCGATEVCWRNVRTNPEGYSRDVNGPVSHFPSVHTERWELYLSVRAGASIASGSTNNARKGKENTMAKVVARKGSKSTSKPAAAKKAAAKPAASKKALPSAADIAKLRQGGKNWDQIKDALGVGAIPARKILAAGGYNNKGETAQVERITATGKALATRLVKERKAGTSFYQLAIATGKSEAEVKKIVEEAGGPTGRVYTKTEKAPAAPSGKGKATTKSDGDPS